jgi:hypothetical protein
MDPDGSDNPDGGCDYSVNGINFGNGTIDDERYGLTGFMFYFGGAGTPWRVPNSPEEYYAYMTGHWLDQTPLQYGGNGHPSVNSTGPSCRYFYPGDSDPMNWGTACQFPNGGYNQNDKYWTEEETGNYPEYRRGIGTMGPFTFESGGHQEIELAYVVAIGQEGPLSSVEEMLHRISALHQAVAEGEIIVPTNQLSVAENEKKDNHLLIYPNPVNDVFHFSNPGNKQLQYELINLFGRVVQSGVSNSRDVVTVSFNSLPSGMYIVKVFSGEEVFTGKVVKR